jgi:hypothetical protein
MDKEQIKKEIIRLCLEKQEQVVNTAREAVEEVQESANEDDQTRDLYDPYRIQLLGKRDLLAAQYEKALQEKQVLEKLAAVKSRDYIDVGSAVITDKQRLFVSIGLGRFECCGETWYAISPKVPLFEHMRGLKKGDTYEFNGQKFTILDVF